MDNLKFIKADGLTKWMRLKNEVIKSIIWMKAKKLTVSPNG